MPVIWEEEPVLGEGLVSQFDLDQQHPKVVQWLWKVVQHWLHQRHWEGWEDKVLRPMDYLRCLVLIFSHHMYHWTILTGLWLPYWTYTLSRYLAAMSCSHTFLNRMMFAQSHDPHCPVSLTPLHTISCTRESVRLLYLQTLLLLTIHMTEHLSAHYWAAVPTPFAHASPYFMMTLILIVSLSYVLCSI